MQFPTMKKAILEMTVCYDWPDKYFSGKGFFSKIKVFPPRFACG